MVRLKLSVRLLTVWRHDEASGVYVSWCPALDLYSQGTTQERAQTAIEEAITLYLKTCYRRKILDNVLVERGFLPSDGEPQQTDSVECETINVTEIPVGCEGHKEIEVPFELTNGQRGLDGAARWHLS